MGNCFSTSQQPADTAQQAAEANVINVAMTQDVVAEEQPQPAVQPNESQQPSSQPSSPGQGAEEKRSKQAADTPWSKLNDTESAAVKQTLLKVSRIWVRKPGCPMVTTSLHALPASLHTATTFEPRKCGFLHCWCTVGMGWTRLGASTAAAAAATALCHQGRDSQVAAGCAVLCCVASSEG